MFRLGDTAAPLSYDLHLAIDPREPTFRGEVRIRVRVNRPIATLWLNAEKLEVADATWCRATAASPRA